MKRYCHYCEKEFDFKINSMKDMEGFICPECGRKIEKNSTKPNGDPDETANKIGNAFGKLYYMAYVFYVVLATIGIIAYLLHFNAVLYVVTAIALTVYLLQVFTGTVIFVSGIVFLPIGAIAGYFILNNTIDGACLGVLLVFGIRHVIRDIFFTLFWKLVRMGDKHKG